jgi:hypothetical protein
MSPCVTIGSTWADFAVRTLIRFRKKRLSPASQSALNGGRALVEALNRKAGQSEPHTRA